MNDYVDMDTEIALIKYIMSVFRDYSVYHSRQHYFTQLFDRWLHYIPDSVAWFHLSLNELFTMRSVDPGSIPDVINYNWSLRVEPVAD